MHNKTMYSHVQPPWLTLLGTHGSSLTSAATPAFGLRVVVGGYIRFPHCYYYYYYYSYTYGYCYGYCDCY